MIEADMEDGNYANWVTLLELVQHIFLTRTMMETIQWSVVVLIPPRGEKSPKALSS